MAEAHRTAVLSPVSQDLAEAIAEDAEALAALHDRELTPGLAAALRETGFPTSLGLIPSSTERLTAWQAMSAGVASLPAAEGDLRAWDDLAAEYAAIYLTGAYGASPYESVWTDDDHLTCQGAMFELRELYARAGLRAPDWRQRAEDHLVLQLQYVAHAARHAASADDWRALATMLDEHLLRWLPDFASRIAARSPSAFYVGLAVLTAAWVDALRDLIASVLQEPRPTRLEVEERLRTARCDLPPEPVPVHFVPGAGGPSW
ncbi:MAG: molecular chaperone [Rhodocyclaceae bacterium]